MSEGEVKDRPAPDGAAHDDRLLEPQGPDEGHHGLQVAARREPAGLPCKACRARARIRGLVRARSSARSSMRSPRAGFRDGAARPARAHARTVGQDERTAFAVCHHRTRASPGTASAPGPIPTENPRGPGARAARCTPASRWVRSVLPPPPPSRRVGVGIPKWSGGGPGEARLLRPPPACRRPFAQAGLEGRARETRVLAGAGRWAERAALIGYDGPPGWGVTGPP